MATSKRKNLSAPKLPKSLPNERQLKDFINEVVVYFGLDRPDIEDVHHAANYASEEFKKYKAVRWLIDVCPAADAVLWKGISQFLYTAKGLHTKRARTPSSVPSRRQVGGSRGIEPAPRRNARRAEELTGDARTEHMFYGDAFLPHKTKRIHDATKEEHQEARDWYMEEARTKYRYAIEHDMIQKSLSPGMSPSDAGYTQQQYEGIRDRAIKAARKL